MTGIPDCSLCFDSLTLPTVLLVTIYAVIISERVNRSIVALVGACLTIGLGVLTQEEAIRSPSGLQHG